MTIVDGQDRTTITTIINDFATHAWDKFARGIQEHGGTLVNKGGLLWEAEQEAIDLVIYQHAVRQQLLRVEEALKGHRYDAAYLMLKTILHGKSSDLLPE